MAQADQPADALVGQLASSKFQIRRLLGAGGMGAVFEAEHVFTKRVGALKLLHEQFARMPEVVERFTREASAAGRIANPHIVETYDAGRLESGQPYMFMELLNGKALDDVLRERGPLSFDQALQVALQAAIGLAAAHKAGIIHRDIKPANLFLVDGQTSLVKLLDFGISKFNVSEGVSTMTQEGATLGTPQYMPSEQIMGRLDMDGRVDVYALGVVLYESVTGLPPFVENTLAALAVRICEGRYTTVGEQRPDTPPEFDRVIARCLAVDREQRYPTMGQLLTDLERIAGVQQEQSLAATMVAATTASANSLPPELARTALSEGIEVAAKKGSQRLGLWLGIALSAAALGFLALVFASDDEGSVAEPNEPLPALDPTLPEPVAAREPEPSGTTARVTIATAAASSEPAFGSEPPRVPAKASPKPSAAAPKGSDGLRRDNPFAE